MQVIQCLLRIMCNTMWIIWSFTWQQNETLNVWEQVPERNLFLARTRGQCLLHFQSNSNAQVGRLRIAWLWEVYLGAFRCLNQTWLYCSATDVWLCGPVSAWAFAIVICFTLCSRRHGVSVAVLVCSHDAVIPLTTCLTCVVRRSWFYV